MELRFLAKAMRGWGGVCSGRSQGYLGREDRRFVVQGIGSAWGELGEVVRELGEVGGRQGTGAVRGYCAEVRGELEALRGCTEVRALLED